MTSMAEFIVQKITERHPEPTKRILCLSEATILERDPQTYSVSGIAESLKLRVDAGDLIDSLFFFAILDLHTATIERDLCAGARCKQYSIVYD